MTPRPARVLLPLAAACLALAGSLPRVAAQQLAPPPLLAVALESRTPAGELVDRINALRAEHGLTALELDPALTELAHERSADMARRGYFSHDIPGVGDASVWALAELPDALETAENLGRTNAPNAAVTAALFDAWVASPGHLRNFLKPTFNRIGIGLAEVAGPGETTTKIVTELFAESAMPLARASVAQAAPE